MQNIDPVVFLQPTMALAISLAAILYWRVRKGFRLAPLLLSLAAYFLAIGAKYAIQLPTIAAVESRFGAVSAGLGLYYGLQTVFLEVGLAYVFALYGARRRGLNLSDSVAYGLSLSFWENGVLLGAISILNLLATYILLGTGTAEASIAYAKILSAEPSLFLPPAVLLPSVLIGILERVSSMLAHIAWGVLCVLSAVTGRKKFVLAALPMGLVDALVPFAVLNTDLFEAGVFLLSVGFMVIAWLAIRSTASLESEVAAPIVGTP